METKICTKCDEVKPLSEFYRNRNRKDGRSCWCKVCRNAHQRRYKAEHREEIAAYMRRYNAEHRVSPDYRLQCMYDVPMGWYAVTLEAQGGGCAICGRSPAEEGKRLYADHNHDTGEMRGLLCNSCNVAIGHLRDDPSLLRRAIAYLEGKS